MQEKLNGNGANDPKRGSAAVRGRPFRPGQSGNPGGKSKGTRNVATRLLEALMEAEAEEIGRKTIELAKAGDSRALKACLDRLAPAPRSRFVPFALPPLETIGDLPRASAALLAAVATGELAGRGRRARKGRRRAYSRLRARRARSPARGARGKARPMSRAMARRLKRVVRRAAKPPRGYVWNGDPDDENRPLTEEEWVRMYVYTEESKADGSEPK